MRQTAEEFRLEGKRGARRGGGFTLLEALILLTILGIISVGAAVGLQSSAKVPSGVDARLAIDRQLTTAMEQTKQTAMSSWATLAGSTSTVTVNGTSYTQTITVTAQNAPDGSGACTDYVLVTVQIGAQSMTTYLAQP